MKKLIITAVLIAIINSILECWLPWWILAVVSLSVCMIARLNYRQSFIAGFFGIMFSWLIMIMLKDIPNHHLLSSKMANLFPLGGNYVFFILFNVFIGSLVGGLSGLCGGMLATNEMND
jgi:hypothetical protein